MSALTLSLNILLLLARCNSNTIQCLGEHSCKNETKICDSDEACMINCNGQNAQPACEDAVIDASSATDVTLRCFFKEDCFHIELFCATESCTIDCKKEDSCDGSSFIIQSSTTFECIGYCPSNANTRITTQMPTISIISTSAFVEMDPSIVHSSKPSVIPSINPTIALLSSTVQTPENVAITDLMTKNGNENSATIVIHMNPLFVVIGVLLVLFICLSVFCVIYCWKRKKDKKAHHVEKKVSLERTYSNDAMPSECDLFVQVEGETHAEAFRMEGKNHNADTNEVDNHFESKFGHIRTPSNSLSHRECIEIELGENEFIVRGDSEDEKQTEGR